MILIISSSSDIHAAAVLGELTRRGAEAYLLDLSLFPGQMRLTMEYDSRGNQAFWLDLNEQTHLNLRECRVVWWRRPQPFMLPNNVIKESHRMFALNESHEAFAGLWQALDAFWVNHPNRDSVAHRKAFQLCVAQEVGLSIPQTLISNDMEKVNKFIAAQGNTPIIFKAFAATEQEWRETRLLGSEELAQLENVRYAPVIFQKYIEAQYDLRITIVGKDIFPAAIYSQETSYKVDFRMDIASARIEAVQLPGEVERQLFALMEKLGLIYGAIDMRLTPSGQYIFLEINPAGQWLFVEERSGQSITASMAALLAAKDY